MSVITRKNDGLLPAVIVAAKRGPAMFLPDCGSALFQSSKIVLVLCYNLFHALRYMTETCPPSYDVFNVADMTIYATGRTFEYSGQLFAFWVRIRVHLLRTSAIKLHRND